MTSSGCVGGGRGQGKMWGGMAKRPGSLVCIFLREKGIKEEKRGGKGGGGGKEEK